MDKKELLTFFKLEDHTDLFEKATKPKSCGGGDEFKQLALHGDTTINRALMDIYSHIKNTGRQTKLRTTFHSARTLIQIGRKLNLDQIISSYNKKHIATNNEIKEAVEALLGASYEVNGYDFCKELVEKMVDMAKEFELFDSNPKGQLLELFQKHQYEMPIFKTERVGGTDHKPLWQCKVSGIYDKKSYQLNSEIFTNTKDAEQDVALKFLYELGVKTKSIYLEPFEESVTLTKEIKQALTADEVTFYKPTNLFDEGEISINIPKKTSIKKWAEKQYNKSPYYFLVQLCAIFDEIRGTAWSAKIETGALILINLEIEGIDFFEIGFGPSKTQARKDVAQKIISSSQLFNWLAKQKKRFST
jgi:dsRNA-specific ribonuclease